MGDTPSCICHVPPYTKLCACCFRYQSIRRTITQSRQLEPDPVSAAPDNSYTGTVVLRTHLPHPHNWVLFSAILFLPSLHVEGQILATVVHQLKLLAACICIAVFSLPPYCHAPLWVSRTKLMIQKIVAEVMHLIYHQVCIAMQCQLS